MDVARGGGVDSVRLGGPVNQRRALVQLGRRAAALGHSEWRCRLRVQRGCLGR